MQTVERLEQALELARQAGYTIRREWLDECHAGACTVNGRKLLFLDPTQSTREQLEEVLEVLRRDEVVKQLTAATGHGRSAADRHAA
ncbi:MAG: hypothetical protein IT427_09620 [Pirellulales bacterium]|nr:hypothetical protein [Pirellulales bacterium]